MGPVRGRILLLQMALSFAAGALVVYGVIPMVIGRDVPETLHLGGMGVIAYGLLFGLLQWTLRRRGSSVTALMGPRPERPTVFWAFMMGGGLLAIAIACTYAVFVPLSWVAPEFVSYWLFEDLPEVFWTSGEYVWLANGINLFVIVVMAPVVEELLFRGLLLPAWSARMGPVAAVVLSSVAFAVMHVEVLGGFIFSAVLSVVFLRTGRLWIPIVIHAANNALAAVLNITGLALGWQWSNSIEALQTTWLYGVIGLAVGVPLLVVTLRRMPARGADSMPLPSGELPGSAPA